MLDILLNININKLITKCVNAIPSYGKLWNYCEYIYKNFISPRNILLIAKFILANEISYFSSIYFKAIFNNQIITNRNNINQINTNRVGVNQISPNQVDINQITPNQALEGQIIPNRALPGSTNGSNQAKRCRPKWLQIKPWSLK